MKVGILGGSFDPPHLGHLLIAQQALEVCGLDEVWFVPYSVRNLGNKQVISGAKHRLKMVSLLSLEDKRFRVSDVDVKRGGVTYSIDTIKDLKKKFSKDDFFWIIGDDLVGEVPRWKDYRELLSEVEFIVFPRHGCFFNNLTNQMNFVVKEVIKTNISSTTIKERVKRGLPIKYMVTDSVEKYIREKGLYK